MVTLRTYNEPDLVRRLSRLDRRSKTAFAASCAQCLLPLFERYSESIGEPALGSRLAAIVSLAWDTASGALEERDLRALQAEAESLVPSDEDDWTFEMGSGEHAAAAAAYAIRTWLTDDPRRRAGPRGRSMSCRLRHVTEQPGVGLERT
jgi:hypothetical protein